MGGTEKTGGETGFKKWRQTGSRAGCLKKGGAGLTNYATFEQTLSVVHASIRCSCFMLQKPLRGEIFKIFGKGENLTWGDLITPKKP